MKIMKSLFLAFPVLFIGAGLLFGSAAKSGEGTVGTIQDDGTKTRPIAAAFSTTVWVEISSRAQDAGDDNGRSLGIEEWRRRQIINCSDGALMLGFGESTGAFKYQQYSSSVGVVMASGTVNGVLSGDIYNDYSDEAIWALWHPGTTTGGICGEEKYYKKEDD